MAWMRKVGVAVACLGLTACSDRAEWGEPAGQRAETPQSATQRWDQTAGTSVDLGVQDERNERDVFVDEGQPGIGGSGADVGLQNERNEKDAAVDEGAAAIGGSGQVGEGVENPAIWNGKDTFKLSGTLTEQNGNDLTISRSNLPPVQLEAHQRTKVSLNGRTLSSGELDRLPVNSKVDAQFQINGDEIIATELKFKGSR